MPDVWIPPQMQRVTGAPDRVQVAGATVRQVINNLEQLHPGIKELLYDAELDDITPRPGRNRRWRREPAGPAGACQRGQRNALPARYWGRLNLDPLRTAAGAGFKPAPVH